MSEIVAIPQQTAIREALKNSLYPGASDESVEMVLAYCRAAGLDPMTKPVHIVPMQVSTGEKDAKGYDIKVNRDVVMPGIGLYRINASRTGQYAGVSEPVYGPIRSMEFKREVWNNSVNSMVDDFVEYPEWCSITVDKLVDGQIRSFVAKEYWLENYATKGKFGAPNSMWAKRPYGQIAKCAEAQALRKAFPEAVGAQPTAEEMEGKTLDFDARSSRPTLPSAGRTKLPAYSDDDFEKKIPGWRELIEKGGHGSADRIIAKVSTVASLNDEQIATIRGLEIQEAEVVR